MVYLYILVNNDLFCMLRRSEELWLFSTFILFLFLMLCMICCCHACEILRSDDVETEYAETSLFSCNSFKILQKNIHYLNINKLLLESFILRVKKIIKDGGDHCSLLSRTSGKVVVSLIQRKNTKKSKHIVNKILAVSFTGKRLQVPIPRSQLVSGFLERVFVL